MLRLFRRGRARPDEHAAGSETQVHRFEPGRQRIVQHDELPLSRERDPQPDAHELPFGDAHDGFAGREVLVPTLHLDPLLVRRDGPVSWDFPHRDVVVDRRVATRRRLEREPERLGTARTVRQQPGEGGGGVDHHRARCAPRRLENHAAAAADANPARRGALLAPGERGEGTDRRAVVLRIPRRKLAGTALRDERLHERTKQPVARVGCERGGEKARDRSLPGIEVERAPGRVSNDGATPLDLHRRPDRLQELARRSHRAAARDDLGEPHTVLPRELGREL